MSGKSPFQVAKETMSGKTTADRIAKAEQAAVSNPAPSPRVKSRHKSTLKLDPKFAVARKARIEAAREADRRAIEAKRKSKKAGGIVKQPDDPNAPLSKKQKALVKAAKQKEVTRKMQKKMQKSHPSYMPKEKPAGYAKGGKVRGCGIARRGLGRAGSRGR